MDFQESVLSLLFQNLWFYDYNRFNEAPLNLRPFISLISQLQIPWIWIQGEILYLSLSFVSWSHLVAEPSRIPKGGCSRHYPWWQQRSRAYPTSMGQDSNVEFVSNSSCLTILPTTWLPWLQDSYPNALPVLIHWDQEVHLQNDRHTFDSGPHQVAREATAATPWVEPTHWIKKINKNHFPTLILNYDSICSHVLLMHETTGSSPLPASGLGGQAAVARTLKFTKRTQPSANNKTRRDRVMATQRNCVFQWQRPTKCTSDMAENPDIQQILIWRRFLRWKDIL